MKTYRAEYFVTGGITIEVEAEDFEQALKLIEKRIENINLGELENENWEFETIQENFEDSEGGN